MSISIDWGTRVISIPRSDLTLIQSVPSEIRELNINSFRLELKSLEDNEDGITHLDTHVHNTEVLFGGLTFARVVSIINGYTVTFEDGQYAVNLVGANSNIGDVTNVNQVSVRSQNSAGLISSRAMEFASFLGGVTIDASSSNTGTLWPVGTPQSPVNNLEDAKLIAELNGFSRLFINGNYTFLSTDNIDGYIIVGQNPIKTHIVMEDGLSSEGCEFREAYIEGYLSGNAYIRYCEVGALTYVEGRITDSTLLDTLLLAGSTTTNIINCRDGIAGDGKPVIDMGGAGQALTITGFYGEIQIKNKTGPEKASIDIDSGEVEIDSTVTNGEIYVRGNGNLSDNSTGSTIVHYSALLSRDVYDDVIYVDILNGTTGTQLPKGTRRHPVNNIEDAKLICEKTHIYTISIEGSVVLESSFSGFKFIAQSLSSGIINLNNQNISSSVFNEIIINGNGIGRFQAIDSYILSGMNDISATLENCILSGTFSIASGASLSANRCNFAGLTTSFNMQNGDNMNFANVSGIFSIQNLIRPYSLVAVTGKILCMLDASCTGGTAFLTGNGGLEDHSAGTTVVNTIINAGSIWEEDLLAHVNSGTTGEGLNQIKTWVNYLRSAI